MSLRLAVLATILSSCLVSPLSQTQDQSPSQPSNASQDQASPQPQNQPYVIPKDSGTKTSAEPPKQQANPSEYVVPAESSPEQQPAQQPGQQQTPSSQPIPFPTQSSPPKAPSQYVVPANTKAVPKPAVPAPGKSATKSATRKSAPAPVFGAPSPSHVGPPSEAPQGAVKPAVQSKRDAEQAISTPKPKSTLKAAGVSKADNHKPVPPESTPNAVIWEGPDDIRSRNLFFGQGGESNQPHPPFVFDKEDKSGTNPKFDVTDAEGKKWRVKLGEEARPEVVASRLLWAVGYFANDDYLLDHAEIPGIELSRGQNLIEGHEEIKNARFARRPGHEKKIGIWKWKDNPLEKTREFNGLRVMMAVMNGWDLKDENNAVYQDEKTGRQLYLASDIGATFGTNGLSLTRARSKGNLERYKDSKFITRATETEVDFATPAKPVATLVATLGFSAKEFADRSSYQWIGHNIPRQDARWIGSLLALLSHEQLEDAFRAGGYKPDDVDEFVAVIESRIDELKAL